MGPIIYTTYGVAMGHRPEVLAATGGLAPAEAGRPRARTAWQGLTRVGCWLTHLLAPGHRRRQDAGSPTGGAAGMRDLTLPHAP